MPGRGLLLDGEKPKAQCIQTRIRLLRILILLFAVAVLYVGFSWLPRNPIAVIEFVDNQGKSIQGVTVKPYALRPKREGGHHGHYLWTKDRFVVPPESVVSDKNGKAIVPYPKYVVERLETSEISVSIRHSRYISENHHLVVSASPPSGAPWPVWKNYIISRLRTRTVVTRPNPLVIKKGEELTLKPTEIIETTSELYAQTSSKGGHDPDFWDKSQSGFLITRKHASGNHAVRLISSNKNNKLLFSDTVDIDIKQGVLNSLSLGLKPGKTVRGRLSDIVPRPVGNGRVVADIVPIGRDYKDRPPRWHCWTKVKEDGSFEISSLPAGKLEIIALCNGYISKSASGKRQGSSISYPQRHVITEDSLDIVIEMEQTARLEVTVLDENGQVFEGAKVSTWPNVRWGDWGSTIFCSDLYNTIDKLQRPHGYQDTLSRKKEPSGFFAISDKTGLAKLSNVPIWMRHFSVDHPNYVLPKADVPGSAFAAPRRQATVALQPGAVTKTTVTLEPRNKDPQRHYE